VIAIIASCGSATRQKFNRTEKVFFRESVYGHFAICLFILIGGIYAKNFHGNGSAGNGRRLCITLFYVFKSVLSISGFLKVIFLDSLHVSNALIVCCLAPCCSLSDLLFSGLGWSRLLIWSHKRDLALISLFRHLFVFLILGCLMDSLAIILICVPYIYSIVIANDLILGLVRRLWLWWLRNALINATNSMNVFVLKAGFAKSP